MGPVKQKQSIKIVRTMPALRKAVAAWRAERETVALVPTMGALHAGHISLVKLGLKKARHVVVSIFVNPTQFAPTEDLSRYPRDEAGDVAKLQEAGADLVWSPTVAEMYASAFATRIVPGGAALGLEGEFRPQHFGGVATVCCKLFSQVTPDIAIFGEKDFQQLAVIRQMVGDLNLPLKILGAPIVREKDGLALSSRNRYLSENERRIAPALYKALKGAGERIAKGKSAPTASVIAAARDILDAGFSKVDYVEVRDPETLAPITAETQRPLRILAAAWLGKTRLIDNVEVGG